LIFLAPAPPSANGKRDAFSVEGGMPHYRFVVRDGSVIDDPNGLLLANDEAAMSEAVQIIRKVKASKVRDFGGWSMEVRDGDRTVGEVAFSQVD
jgi:hypothetical protein